MSDGMYDSYKMLARMIIGHKQWDGYAHLALFEDPKGELHGFQVDESVGLFGSPIRFNAQTLKPHHIGRDFSGVRDWLISAIGKDHLNSDLNVRFLFYSFAGGDEGEVITETIQTNGKSAFTRDYNGLSAQSEPDNLIPHGYKKELTFEEVIEVISRNGHIIIDTRREGYSWLMPLEWRGYLKSLFLQMLDQEPNNTALSGSDSTLMVHGIFQFSSAITESKPSKLEDFIWHHQGPGDNPLWVLYTDLSGKTQLGVLSNNRFFESNFRRSDLISSTEDGLWPDVESLVRHVVNETLADHDTGKVLWPQSFTYRLYECVDLKGPVLVLETFEFPKSKSYQWKYFEVSDLMLEDVDGQNHSSDIPSLPPNSNSEIAWRQSDMGWLFAHTILSYVKQYAGKRL